MINQNMKAMTHRMISTVGLLLVSLLTFAETTVQMNMRSTSSILHNGNNYSTTHHPTGGSAVAVPFATGNTRPAMKVIAPGTIARKKITIHTIGNTSGGYDPIGLAIEAQHEAFTPMTSTSSIMPVVAISTPLVDITEEVGAPRRVIINPSDPGNQSNESPVGEPWVLLLFAAIAAGTTAWRRRIITSQIDK